LYRYNLILLLLIVSCKTDSNPLLASSVKNTSSTVSEVAKDNKSQAGTIKKLSTKQGVHNAADKIIENSRTLEKSVIVLDGYSRQVSKNNRKMKDLTDENTRLNSSSNKHFNIAMTALSVLFIIAAVFSFQAHSYKKAISFLGGVLICFAASWFLHHIGIVIAAFVILTSIYFFIKDRKSIFKEMHESVEVFKGMANQDDKKIATIKLNSIQSGNTKKLVRQHKKQKVK